MHYHKDFKHRVELLVQHLNCLVCTMTPVHDHWDDNHRDELHQQQIQCLVREDANA